MLKEHLTQDHDLASRRTGLIDRQVEWLNAAVLSHQPARVLDLGCGPGLYTSRLARFGHTCTGIDFSPASIRHAQETARREGLACTYLLEDLRRAEYGSGFRLALLLYGEFHVFSPASISLILRKAFHALEPGGVLVLEPQPLESTRAIGLASDSWYTSLSGLFSDQPHLALEEHFWYEDRSTAVVRYAVIDAARGEVTLYSSSYQGCTSDQLRSLLQEHGFENVAFYPSLLGEPHPDLQGFIAVTAQKPA
jgi:SAM-dependent methyltransferase